VESRVKHSRDFFEEAALKLAGELRQDLEREG
jgi:hypothetical protein